MYLNPSSPHQKPIDWIHTITDKELSICQSHIAPNSRGGMLSKLTAAQKLLNAGIPAIIANGRTENIIHKIIKGENIGTTIQKHKPTFHS